MPTAAKAEAIEQAKDWYTRSNGIVFTDFKGLQVKELQALRSDLRKKGAEIHILKNTLFRIAAGDDISKLADEYHNGTTAFAFVFENETDVAKALVDYARVGKKLVVKGGFFGGKALTAKQVEQLALLPLREILLAQVIGAIAAPISTLIGTIEALYADPIRTIGAVADKVAEANPIPAAPAPAPAAEAPASAPVEAAAAAEPEATVEAQAEAEPASATEPEAAATEEAPAESETPAPASEEAAPEPEAPAAE